MNPERVNSTKVIRSVARRMLESLASRLRHESSGSAGTDSSRGEPGPTDCTARSARSIPVHGLQVAHSDRYHGTLTMMTRRRPLKSRYALMTAAV